MHITILGIDPGKANFAASVVEVNFELPFNYKIIEMVMVDSTIQDLTGNVIARNEKFKKEIRKVVKRWKIDAIVAERYQNRGRMKGNTGELVSVMLGTVLSMPVEDVTLITASQWKNEFNKHYNLDDFYKEIDLVAHKVDATCIALYGAAQYLGCKPFTFLDNAKKLEKFKKQLNSFR